MMLYLENITTPENLSSKTSFYNQDFEIAELLFQSGSFSKSLPYFEKVMKHSKEARDFDSYFACYLYIMTISNEIQELDKIKLYKKEVENLCEKEKLTETPLIKAYSCYYLIYIDKDLPKVFEVLNSSLKMTFDLHDQAIQSENFLKQNQSRFEIAVFLYVYCIYYFHKKDYKNCLRELENLESLLKDLSCIKKELKNKLESTAFFPEKEVYTKAFEYINKKTPEVQKMLLGIQYIDSLIQIHYLKQYDQADKKLWKLFEQTNKYNFNYMIPAILSTMSYCQDCLGNKNQAILFYNLAQKKINPERKLFFKNLERLKQKINIENQDSQWDKYDMIFHKTSHKFIEKRKGILDLKNQFILIDLLKLLLLNRGTFLSKEKLVKELWREEYHSEIHDNKLYVTIKRLREAVELNSSKPSYICRNSYGYYFSKSAKVLIKED